MDKLFDVIVYDLEDGEVWEGKSTLRRGKYGYEVKPKRDYDPTDWSVGRLLSIHDVCLDTPENRAEIARSAKLLAAKEEEEEEYDELEGELRQKMYEAFNGQIKGVTPINTLPPDVVQLIREGKVAGKSVWEVWFAAKGDMAGFRAGLAILIRSEGKV